jgi:hypothetical protein
VAWFVYGLEARTYQPVPFQATEPALAASQGASPPEFSRRWIALR